MFYIWKWERGEWWAPDSRGYSRDLEGAGLYTAEEAGKIVANAHPPGNNVAVPKVLAERHEGPPPVLGAGPLVRATRALLFALPSEPKNQGEMIREAAEDVRGALLAMGIGI